MGSNDPLWNVVWKDEHTDCEAVSLAYRKRGEALAYVEQYFPAYKQQSLHLWYYIDGPTFFSIRLEKL